MPTPGAAFMTISTWPNIMYQFEINVGASPDPAIVNDAPFESYFGFPLAVQSLEGPWVKSYVVDLLNAGSG